MKTILPFLLLIISSPLIYAQANRADFQSVDSLIELNKGSLEKALPLLLSAQEKSKEAFGIQDSLYGFYTEQLGLLYKQQRQYGPSEKQLLLAKEVYREAFGAKHKKYAECVLRIAELYRDWRKYKDALFFFGEAEILYLELFGRNSYNYANLNLKMGVVHFYTGQYEEAESYYLQSKSIFSTLGEEGATGYTNSMGNLGGLYYYMGRYEEAEPLFIESQKTTAKLVGTKAPLYATKLNNLAVLYIDMLKYKQAEELYLESKSIREQTIGTEHQDYAVSLGNLASLYVKQQDYARGVPLFKRALEIYAKKLGKNHPNYGATLNNLAFTLSQSKQYDLAIPLYLESLERTSGTLGQSHPAYLECMNNLAMLYTAIANYDLAWEYLNQFSIITTKTQLRENINNQWVKEVGTVEFTSGKHRYLMMQSLEHVYNLLKLENKENNKEKRGQVVDLANILLNKIRSSLSDSKSKLRSLSLSNFWMFRGFEIFDRSMQSDLAFEMAEQNKSVLLLEASKSERNYRLGNLPDSISTKEKQLIKTRDALKAKLAEPKIEAARDSLRALLNQANESIQELTDLIEKQYPQYAKLKYATDKLKVKEIQASLSPQTALIEYVLGDTTIHIFYIDKKEFKWFEEKVSSKNLEKKVVDLHDALSNYKLLDNQPKKSYQKYTIAAHWCFEKLLKTPLEVNKNITNLIIIPDGKLGHLPFESFLITIAPQSETPYSKLDYLLNKYTVNYNHSASLWKDNAESTHKINNKRIFAMAANYEDSLANNLISSRLPIYQRLRKTLGSLPQAKNEVEVLKANFEGYFGFDKEATECNFKEKAGNYAIIHLAMHGILNKKSPVLSSLVFTENGDSLENNFLQAYEISKLELNADLVVLSACETGYGKFEKGNGIASLARSFMYAGASSLVVTLWQVNDYATAAIMQQFYMHLKSGERKDVALQKAKLDYLNRAEGFAGHPAFWSPFIQIGNTNPIELDNNSFGRIWWIGGIGIVGLLAMLFLIKKRSKNESA